MDDLKLLPTNIINFFPLVYQLERDYLVLWHVSLPYTWHINISVIFFYKSQYLLFFMSYFIVPTFYYDCWTNAWFTLSVCQSMFFLFVISYYTYGSCHPCLIFRRKMRKRTFPPSPWSPPTLTSQYLQTNRPRKCLRPSFGCLINQFVSTTSEHLGIYLWFWYSSKLCYWKLT